MIEAAHFVCPGQEHADVTYHVRRTSCEGVVNDLAQPGWPRCIGAATAGARLTRDRDEDPGSCSFAHQPPGVCPIGRKAAHGPTIAAAMKRFIPLSAPCR